VTAGRRFVIAGTQRTGTTLLRTSLSSHPDIVCHGEVFKTGRSPYALPDGYWAFSRRSRFARVKAFFRPRASTAEFLHHVFDRPECHAVGFKLMLSHCKSRPYLWQQVSDHVAAVVLMTRKNVLKTLVSRRAAAKSGVYHVSASLPVKTAVRDWSGEAVSLDVATLLQDLDDIAAEPDEWRRLIGGSDSLEVTYEDYVECQPDWNSRVLGFLDVRALPLHSDLKKVNPDSLRALVANYDQVAQVLRQSPYAFCLASGI
jgi:Sulfotransferase family